MLTDPNPKSPANVEAAKLYETNRREYNRRVAEIVEMSWEHCDNSENDDDDDDDDDNGKTHVAIFKSLFFFFFFIFVEV